MMSWPRRQKQKTWQLKPAQVFILALCNVFLRAVVKMNTIAFFKKANKYKKRKSISSTILEGGWWL